MPAEQELLKAGDLGTLARLFALGVDVALADVEALPTVYPDDLTGAGLARISRGRVEALVAIDGVETGTDPIYVVADRIRRDDQQFDPGLVGGLTPTLETVIGLVPRRVRGRLLDAGCRSGALGLLLAAGRDLVVATESAHRAVAFARFNVAFNQAANVDVREGELFDPAAGGDFDLVVSDRPRVGSLDRAGGPLAAPADEATEAAVTGAAGCLRAGGWAIVTGQWALVAGQSVGERVGAWVAGTRCDAMVLHQRSERSESHLAGRLRPLGRWAPSAADDLYARWSEDLVSQRIVEIGSGIIILRRRVEGDAWFTVRQFGGLPAGDLTGALDTLFQNQDWLAHRPEPGRMLAEALRLPAGVLLRPASRIEGGRWVPDGFTANAAGGLFRSARLSEPAAAVLTRGDGRAPLSRYFDEVYGQAGVRPPNWEQTVEEARRGLDEVARQLVGMGLLVVPPGP